MLSPSKTKVWPSGDGKDVLAVYITDSDLEKKTGLRLSSGTEVGLGNWIGLGGVLPSGCCIEFVRYIDAKNELGDQFIVRADKISSTPEVIAEVIDILQLETSSVAWRSGSETT